MSWREARIGITYQVDRQEMWAFFHQVSLSGETEESGKAGLQRDVENQESGAAGSARFLV